MSYLIKCWDCGSFEPAGRVPGLWFRFCDCGNLAVISTDDDAERAYDLKRKHESKEFYREQKKFRKYLWR